MDWEYSTTSTAAYGGVSIRISPPVHEPATPILVRPGVPAPIDTVRQEQFVPPPLPRECPAAPVKGDTGNFIHLLSVAQSRKKRAYEDFLSHPYEQKLMAFRAPSTIPPCTNWAGKVRAQYQSEGYRFDPTKMLRRQSIEVS